MKRNTFIKTIAAGSIVPGAMPKSFASHTINKSVERPTKKVLMKVGCQSGGTSEENLQFKSRCGVYNIDGDAPKVIAGKGWDLEDSFRKRDACEKYGISLDAYHWPLSSAGIDKQLFPNILLGKSPERDREIEMLQQMIMVAAKTGIKVLNYNTTILKVERTGRTIDIKRGNAEYSTWNYTAALKHAAERTIAGDVTIDQLFDRITYLLERVLPVAEEYKVKLANHIADPPMPASYKGIMRWNSPNVFAGIKRFAQLSSSPYHGFNFCIGSIAEGLHDPAMEILPIIKWVGDRNQIFNVHLRNIKGGFNDFQEVYPDNGVLNYIKCIRALRDVGFDGMVMPDHVPYHADPNAKSQSFAFCYGYIKAMIQAVSEEGV